MLQVDGGTRHPLPTFTIGWHVERDGRTYMPLAIQVHQAAADGSTPRDSSRTSGERMAAPEWAGEESPRSPDWIHRPSRAWGRRLPRPGRRLIIGVIVEMPRIIDDPSVQRSACLGTGSRVEGARPVTHPTLLEQVPDRNSARVQLISSITSGSLIPATPGTQIQR
ncbi:CatA-like O-acetyltransferase [Janibacter sp. UYMM211]|uniref:CatA-like O-acetyltransferase n=1 Tax=Janibacter sp. UYMM211 TaxID=3156342 RepID=UPI003391C094